MENDYQTFMQTFAKNYIVYLQSKDLCIAKWCRRLEANHNVHLGGSQTLYKWKYKQAKKVTIYTLLVMCNAVDKPIEFFTTNKFKIN